MSNSTGSVASKTVTIKPGETFTLPQGAEVQFVSDSTNISTDCASLPTATYKCGLFLFVIDNDNNTGHPFDENTCRISKLYVGDIVYNIDLIANQVDPDGSHPNGYYDTLNSKIPDQGLFSFTAVLTQDYVKRKYLKVYFRVISTYFDKLELEIDERDDSASPPSPLLMYSKPIEYDCGSFDYSF